MKINYWYMEIYVEFQDQNDTCISVLKSSITIDVTDQTNYGGSVLYIPKLSFYDICCLEALWQEVYGDE